MKEVLEQKNVLGKKVLRGVSGKPGSGSEVFHLTNGVAKAQKQISSQETIGLMDQE
ncbi:hypothetical protein KZ483_15600 [Paenibacillus sp. sptzw28]|uniref:hypothetical protein n=1 Tax=Paenibacillus sp. sptzw28 TaxID=715179 RepID=UPI001C6F4C10|nr:hypothetical protein [Paenibacillus sp. sptzw28]QYR19355.1 hypothetical protein KZ483_15600 [Paenibacillus sp. sptzw28]